MRLRQILRLRIPAYLAASGLAGERRHDAGTFAVGSYGRRQRAGMLVGAVVKTVGAPLLL